MHQLNEQQQRGVEVVDGRVLILAGAGSGKTRVLTHRIAYLVQYRQVSPRAILGLTFTNKAAAEMRERVTELIAPNLAKQVTLSTFHSFCLNILRQDITRLGYSANFTLYDEHDVKRILNYIARDMLDTDSEMPSMAKALSLINQAKNKGWRPEQIVDTTSKWHQDFTRTLFSRFEEAMRAYNAVDFDHLLTLTVELFQSFPDVLEKYQERYRYIMIDEYQDTNPVQYRLADLLSAKYQNLCVVGDDDQSIYGWRGAEMRNILNFGAATTIKLEQNYRSTGIILRAANAVIGNNSQRHDKVLWSDCGEGQPIEVFVAPNEADEALGVVTRMAKLRGEGQYNWGDMAILYRSNALSRQFEQALLKQPWYDGKRWVTGIPYQIYGGTNFFERKEIRDLFAYLRVVVNSKDEEAILRIINQPRRGVGEAGLDKLTTYNRTQAVPLWQVVEGVCGNDAALIELKQTLSAKFIEGLNEFYSIIQEAKEKFNQLPLNDTLKWLIERIDYQRAINEEVKSTKMRAMKEENVAELVNAIAEYQLKAQSEGEQASLEGFINSLPLQGEEAFRMKSKNKGDRVSLMTFHSAKGLEFPVCFLVCVEGEIIPHAKSMQDTGIEEERRLMYVAITRAMRQLTISMAIRRMRMGKDEKAVPSPFLFEIPTDCIKSVKWI